jgi:hypothetical protein
MVGWSTESPAVETAWRESSLVVLVNEKYKTRDCKLPNERLCSPNI